MRVSFTVAGERGCDRQRPRVRRHDRVDDQPPSRPGADRRRRRQIRHRRLRRRPGGDGTGAAERRPLRGRRAGHRADPKQHCRFHQRRDRDQALNGVVGTDPKSGPYTVDQFTGSVTVNGVLVTGVLSANHQVVTYFANTNGNGTIGDLATRRTTASRSTSPAPAATPSTSCSPRRRRCCCSISTRSLGLEPVRHRGRRRQRADRDRREPGHQRGRRT